MRRTFLVFTACLALATGFIAPPSASAQSHKRLQVTFRNDSFQCVWMTIYRVRQGLMGFEILKGYGADPQMVRPFGSVSVSIPPQDGIRMRNEIKYTCNGGGGRTTHDTQFTQVPLLDRWNHADFVLHHNMHTSSYFISGNFH